MLESGIFLRRGVRPYVSIVALASALALVAPLVAPEITGGIAFADEGGESGHGGGHDDGQGGQGQGGQGQGGQGQGGGHDGDDHDHEDGDDHADDGHGGGNSGQKGQDGQGQGEPDSDSEGRGPKYGQGGSNTGGKPVWAQEGIPEVELGRLNVARAPDRVLEQAKDEALKEFTDDHVGFYSQSLEDMIYDLRNDWDNVSIIDSPVSNLGLLKDVLDGSSDLADKGVVNSPEVLAAVFLGTASDKNVEISDDTAKAIGLILGFDLSDSQAAALAADAEDIRQAILDGHG